MTTYLKVLWHHDFPDEPVELYSEINDDGWETRKVEIYRDGHAGYADRTESTGATWLSETSMASIAEIAAQSEFTPSEIDSAAFEQVWRNVST